ncbi:response regulator [Roseospira marina]|uniref:Response regulator n=1 Tax=Roseospira marina TaxID=140057 RepID=A0A5M6IA73_9PROT|nr:response regulator [Roseospira marina]KAA5605176.1 response regulator [Roseospira marina]MBB4314934.1 CheY-like chemotaxis protein [Roseospira marina]MBB5087934.1 CheY-like chemotaxis protein [Roseospira marina]
MRRVLLVEDNEDNARALTRLLARRGYDMVTAGTGADAVRLAFEAKPDVILMDIGLPDFDGLEATRRIKANPECAAIPVIALTAHALIEDQRAALGAGCVNFSPKPVNLPSLLSLISAALESQREQHDGN